MPRNYFSRDFVEKKTVSTSSIRVQKEKNFEKKYAFFPKDSLLLQQNVNKISMPNKKNRLNFDEQEKLKKSLKRWKHYNKNFYISMEELTNIIAKELDFRITSCNLRPFIKKLGIHLIRKVRERKSSLGKFQQGQEFEQRMKEFERRMEKNEKKIQRILSVLISMTNGNHNNSEEERFTIIDILNSIRNE